VSTLQVHITAGAQTGARLQLNQHPVTFGRSAENTLVLDLPVVSRLHGELTRDEQGRWVLVNHSQNGTRVGRKKVTKKPQLLTEGAAVIIGDTEVFRVHLVAAVVPVGSPDSYADNGDDSDAAPRTAPKGRSKLWIGLGIWFTLCIGLMIFFATLRGDDKGDGNSGAGIYIPGNEIEDLEGEEAGVASIKNLLVEPLPFSEPNASRYSRHLDSARQSATAGPMSLYDAYSHYQQAITYCENREEPLPSLDKLQFEKVIDQLATIIYDRYINAYRLFKRGDYKQASNILDRLRMEFYKTTDPEDPLANHIKRLRNAAHARS